MICLFNSTASKSDLIQTNGDYILDMLCTSAIITEELNGEYSFDGVFRISDTFPKALYDMLTEESILKVSEEYGEEYFRIAKVIKSPKSITVFARHITISDILTLWCEDVRPENQNGAGAISWIYNNSIGNKLLTVNSDIANTSTAYYVNKNVYECLFTADNSFLDRWGGEVYRRGLKLSINQKVGADRGVTIRSKKNLTGFEASTSVDNLITRIYPKGYDGITIEEKYIDSEYINNYARIYSKEVKFDDVKLKDENNEEGFETLAEAQEELKRRVKQMYEVDRVDLLTASYRINFVELGKTEEYKNLSILEKTWLGDTVEVIEDTLGVNISVRVLKRKFDVLKNKRTETELSNKNIKEKPPTIQQVINEIQKLPTVDNFLQIAKDQATNIINAGINGYVVANKNEILIMDTSDKNTATKVWRFNVNGIGYSNTGYYGEYGTAITMEGQIVADFITTGILNANLIKAGILQSLNGKTSFNLETGVLDISDGNIIIRNILNQIVMYCNNQGWLTVGNLFVNGTEAPANIEIGGAEGNKGIGIRTNNQIGTVYIDFAGLDKETSYEEQIRSGIFHRIASYSGERDTLAIEVADKLDIRKPGGSVNMTVQGKLSTSGNIRTSQNISADGSVSAGSFIRGGYTLIATDTIDTIKYANNAGKSYLEIKTPKFGTWGVDIWASDESLKENIKTSKVNALDHILNINLKSYNYVDGINVENGFIAQELAKISEDLVLRVVQSDGTEILQPRASGIIPWLTKAMQEQNVYIKQLENENLKLKEEATYHSESILDNDYRLTSLELGI